MKKALIMLVALSILVLAAGTALAGASEHEAGGPFQMRGFTLTEEQAAQIQAVRELFREQLQHIRDQVREICTGDNRGAAAEEVSSLRHEIRSLIMAVLTPEQVEEFEARVGRMPRHRRGQ